MPSSPESHRAMNSTSPSSPGRLGNDSQRLKNREEMRVMRAAGKEFRKLCRDYGISVGDSDDHRVTDKPKRGRSRRFMTNDTDRDEEMSSSDDEYDLGPSEGGSEGLGNHARWSDIQKLLNELQTRKRLRAVKDISKTLDDSADRAAMELEELDELEQREGLSRQVSDEGSSPRNDQRVPRSPTRAQSGAEHPSGDTGKEAGEKEQSVAQDVAAELQADNDLLNFKASDMNVAQALRRCLDLVPELKKRVEKKSAERSSMRKSLSDDDDLEEELPTHNSSSADDADLEEPQQKSIVHDVNRKLRSFGDLGRDAPHDLRIVLEEQRREIRALASRIDDGERKVKTQRLALAYIDNNVDTAKVDPALLRAAINTTQDMRSRIFKARKTEEETRMRNERLERNMPSEVEAQDVMDECARLGKESERATERVERLLEFTASTASTARQSLILGDTADHVEAVQAAALAEGADSPSSVEEHHGESPVTPSALQVPNFGDDMPSPMGAQPLAMGPAPSGGRRRAVRAAGLLQPAPQLEVSHEKAPELHKKLKAEAAKLDGEIDEQQKRISNSEVIMRNAETTLKVLEETKTLFLEHIAREKPSLLGDTGLIPSDDGKADDAEGSDLESEEDPFESRDIAETIRMLEGEESWLRMELDMANKEFEESFARQDSKNFEQASPTISTQVDVRPTTASWECDEEKTFGDVRKLAVRVEQQIKNMKQQDKGQPAQDQEQNSEDSSSHSTESEDSEDGSESPESMATPSQSANRHEDVQKLLELRHENAKLLQNIKEAQEELKDLRESSGAPGTLPHPGTEPDADTEESAAHLEVQRKQRELFALRKRWWSERQDPQTTVRRALAVAELPLQRAKEAASKGIEATDVDVPPATMHSSLFQRIYTSMTIA